MIVWVSFSALRDPVGSRPYHRDGRRIADYEGGWLDLTLCGCAIQYEGSQAVMVPLAERVARTFARPCKDCVRRAGER